MTIPGRPLLEFPCVFPLKVIGHNVEEFEPEMFAIIQKHVPEVKYEHSSRRVSAGNKYRALTITFVADSQEQLDALYLELNGHELVKVTL